MAPLATAAVLRLAVMLIAFSLTGTRVMTQGDSVSYLDPGRSLVQHGAFSAAGAPETDRTPGYPLFAMFSGMYWDNVLLTVVSQIAISLISLLLVARIAERIFPHRSAGLAAAWLFAVEPLSVMYTVRVMPETLFVLLLLMTLDCVLSFEVHARLRYVALGGIVLAAATFVRPISYYLGFMLAVGIAVTGPRQRGFKWKAPTVFLLAFVPWLAGWQLRNKVETGYSGFSSIVETNLYFFQSAEVSAELDRITLGAQQKKLGYPTEGDYLAAHPEQRAWTQMRRLSYMRTRAVQIVKAHPWLYFKTHVAGVAVVAFTPAATELLQLFNAYPADGAMPHRILNEGIARSVERVLVLHPGVMIMMAVLEAFLLLLYLLAMRGCFRPGVWRLGLITLAGIGLYFLLISGGAQAVGRYRLPLMPLLCILAAGGIPAQKKGEP